MVGLLVPMGFVDASALSYDRAHMLGSNLIGKLVLAALLVGFLGCASHAGCAM